MCFPIEPMLNFRPVSMTMAAILEPLDIACTSGISSDTSTKFHPLGSYNEEFRILKIFHIFAVSMETAAILNHSMVTATLHLRVLNIIEFHQLWSFGFREISWTKCVEEK